MAVSSGSGAAVATTPEGGSPTAPSSSEDVNPSPDAAIDILSTDGASNEMLGAPWALLLALLLLFKQDEHHISYLFICSVIVVFLSRRNVSFIHSSVRSFVHSLICSFIHSFFVDVIVIII